MSESKFDVMPPSTPPVSISSTSTEVNRTGSWKYIQPAYHDRVAPCSAGCPTGVDIQGYMTMLREGRITEAAELLLRENPMPAISGRVCNHPCEDVCSRSVFDGAVAIHAVERMLGDQILQSPLPPAEPPSHAERIAVIGSGPAGLACAYHLTRLGYATEIFEREQKAGGMLRVGIPEYRLPRAVLDQQLERYKAMGIVMHTGIRAGADYDWTRLMTEFAAVFIASGAHVSKALELEGDAGSDAMLGGLDFLRTVNRGERPNLGRRVIVIGGGNTAMDCARTALRLGAEVTTIVYRRTRTEMPAIEEEIQDAQGEGVKFVYLAAPARLVSADGQLTLICNRMQLGDKDAQGRRSSVESGEPPLPLHADTIITAIGEDAELQMLPGEIRDASKIDEWGSSTVARIFMGGDLAGDTRTVASALGAGKRAAIGIDRYLRIRRGESFADELAGSINIAGSGVLSMVRWTDSDPVKRVSPVNETVTAEEINTSYFARAARRDDHRSDQPGTFVETNGGLTPPEALSEVARCFQCGVCNECELCHIYCSDAAIQRDPAGGFVIDLDHCKGCGVCAVECPRGAIIMERLSAQI